MEIFFFDIYDGLQHNADIFNKIPSYNTAVLNKIFFNILLQPRGQHKVTIQ